MRAGATAKRCRPAARLGWGVAMLGTALVGAMQAQFFGFIAPDNYVPVLTFQVWVMLVVGGAGDNRGALPGAVVVWAPWSLSGMLFIAVLPGAWQVRGAALRVVAIGVALAGVLLARPRGLVGERATVSRHVEGEG
ncbi:MAG TPA: hypothetical protein VFN46_04855 [Acetobacteraceae bacterium]|nr:hypothetical protein [Acetobacteraceae bacterium]